ncbi:hypothetical protein G9A89_005359 [Geosiphon pyriformis]|nr:hypothetical protein G9A89_005359 [Geosiphon pyriformis]
MGDSNMTSSYTALDELFVFLNTTINQISRYYSRVPGSSILRKYIQNSHQNDPYRSLLELLLVCFVIWYLFAKRYRTDNFIELTPKEVEELVEEWQPEPLFAPISEKEKWDFEKTPIIVGPQKQNIKLINGQNLLSLASYDFLGLSNNEEIKGKAIQTLRRYGVGACGPPGFYGTLDVHTEFEKNVSEFLGTEESIIYSQGFSTISSAIPSFCKRGDIIIADKGCNFAIQKGVQISRSIVRWFDHNDMNDLERILREIKVEDLETGRRLTRRFIVTEGIFANFGDIAPLPKLIELKKKYKYRLILDESVSFGTMGKRGAGLTDYFNLEPKEVDMIVGSMCHALGSSGGFCSGSHEITDYQRISGPAYCFSAALPAMLAVSASESLGILSRNPDLISILRENARVFRTILENTRYIKLDGALESPLLHLRLTKEYSELNDINNNDQKERILQEIVDETMNNGFLLTRAKYVRDQELFGFDPSIRICISVCFTKKDIEKAAFTIQSAIMKTLNGKVK